ncbi:MAG: MEDS domain-containing protein [Desulfovermiculus sp.]
MPELSSMLDLAIGDHVCCMYMTEQEHQNILVPFIRDGLEHGDKIFYVVDTRTAEAVLASLDESGIVSSDYLVSGQLVILESRDTYIQDGVFDPDRMLSMLDTETDKALHQGFRALRITGEMSWALRGLPGSERLMEYEGKLNQFFFSHQAIGLCQYDMRRFQPEILLDVLTTHPIAVVRDTCYENMYYMPPEEFLGPNRAHAELRRRIKNLEERRQLDLERRENENRLKESEARARREAAFTNAVLDTAGALILVLDREGSIIRFNSTCEQLSGYSAQEVLGQSLWSKLIPEEEHESTRAVFDDLRSGNYPKRLENEWVTKDGSRIRVAWSNTSLMDESNQVDLIISIGLDITEISLLEKAQSMEMHGLKAYSGNGATSQTAASLGVHPLSQSHPDAYYHLVVSMQKLLNLALEKSVYKIDQGLPKQLKEMAETFGHFQAGPKDLVQVYIQALQAVTQGKNPKMTRAYTHEGRLLLVELMGYLAAFYFHHCLGKDTNFQEQRRGAS